VTELPAIEHGSAVKEQLDRLLASAQFARSERLGRLLTFIVESGLRGDVTGLKESVIGREVYDRGDEFDGRIDPIVRTEIRRLRRKLLEYYESTGLGDPIVIEIPKGGYVPVFQIRDAARPRLEGEAIGGYKVVERLGSGAAGQVYRVVEAATGEEFAVRLLSPDLSASSRAIESLVADLGSAAALSHENVLPVDVVERTAEGVLLRSRYREGITLEDRLFSDALTWPQAHAIATQMLSGLSAAHSAGIVHGHLKLSNILISDESGDLQVRILDFGTRSLAGRTVLTPDRRRLGTTGYQQCHGTEGKSSDVRSAGAILYALFAGSFPTAPVSCRPQPVPWLPAVPEQYRHDLGLLICRCLSAAAAERFEDAVDLARAYHRVFDGSGLRQRKAHRWKTFLSNVWRLLRKA
jgi:serine/threonine protein kinase